MKQFEKPNIVLSKCLEHDHCRFDGTMIKSEVVKSLIPYVNFITVCPEMAIGLPAPRESMRIIRDESKDERLVLSQSGVDKTDLMSKFSTEFLQQLNKNDIDGFILKHRSPSCGMNDVKIYKGIGKSDSIPGKTHGIFGKSVVEMFSTVPVENEGRLRNFAIKEQFMIRIFTLRSFKKMKYEGQFKDLIAFHSANKYLFMSLSPGHLKSLGKLVANHDKSDFTVVLESYEAILVKALHQPLNRSRNINVLLHIYGYFKTLLTSKEKAYFLENLELYNQKKLPYSTLLSILKSWVIRFEEPYLHGQTIFEPYPVDLFDVTDSGKGL